MSNFIFCYHCIPALDYFVLTYVLLSYHLFFPFSYNMSWLLLAHPIILLLSPQIFVLSFFFYSSYFHFYLLFSLSKGISHHLIPLPAFFLIKDPLFWLYIHQSFVTCISLLPPNDVFFFFLFFYHLINICKCMMIYFLLFEKQWYSWTSIYLTYFRFLQH